MNAPFDERDWRMKEYRRLSASVQEVRVKEWFPEAHQFLFEPTGMWIIYPDNSEKSFPIGISRTPDGAWRKALDEVTRLRANAEYAKERSL